MAQLLPFLELMGGQFWLHVLNDESALEVHL